MFGAYNQRQKEGRAAAGMSGCPKHLKPLPRACYGHDEVLTAMALASIIDRAWLKATCKHAQTHKQFCEHVLFILWIVLNASFPLLFASFISPVAWMNVVSLFDENECCTLISLSHHRFLVPPTSVEDPSCRQSSWWSPKETRSGMEGGRRDGQQWICCQRNQEYIRKSLT